MHSVPTKVKGVVELYVCLYDLYDDMKLRSDTLIGFVHSVNALLDPHHRIPLSSESRIGK